MYLAKPGVVAGMFEQNNDFLKIVIKFYSENGMQCQLWAGRAKRNLEPAPRVNCKAQKDALVHLFFYTTVKGNRQCTGNEVH